MNIGITINIYKDLSIWGSYAEQYVFFLARAIQKSNIANKIYLINCGNATFNKDVFDYASWGVEIIAPADVKNAVDVIIEAGTLMPAKFIRYQKSLGKKIVLASMANPYFDSLVEPSIFDKKQTQYLGSDRYDQVWVVPQHKDFVPMLKTVTNCPVLVGPYLWDNDFIIHRAIQIQNQKIPNIYFGFDVKEFTEMRVGIFEKNISFNKNFFIPLIACDAFHREHPNIINKVYSLNTFDFKSHSTLLHLASSLDLVKENKATFERNYEFAGFMAEYSNVVVSNTFKGEDDYFLLEALFGKYPVIHNSEYLREVGFYYKDQQIDCAVEQLCKVANYLKKNMLYYEDYNCYETHVDNKNVLDKLSSFDLNNIAFYSRSLLALMNYKS